MQSKPTLVIGATGQIARALSRIGSFGSHTVVCRGRPDCDITDLLALQNAIRSLKPAAVINAAAFTAVDRAEAECKEAFAANAEGPELLARVCRDHEVPLVHISTDYVFSGKSLTPYIETDEIAPISVYGASKAAGEAAIRDTWGRHLILRTAWVYSLDGNNFLKTMLRLGAERDEIAVVDDQRGSPTNAADIASVIIGLLPNIIGDPNQINWGTYHLTNRGETTWFGFASEIFRLTADGGLKSPRLRSIKTCEYPTPARRPAYSVLDNSKIERVFGLRMPNWPDSLATCLASWKNKERAEKVSK